MDCHNVEYEGAVPLPTAALLQQTAMQLTAGGAGQGRMSRGAAAAAVAAAPYWPLGQPLPAVSAGAATPTASAGVSQAQTQREWPGFYISICTPCCSVAAALVSWYGVICTADVAPCDKLSTLCWCAAVLWCCCAVGCAAAGTQ